MTIQIDSDKPTYDTIKTRIQQVNVSDTKSLRIYSLSDHMQYADPHGHAEQLGINSAIWPLFGLVWPSSIQLARKLKNRPVCQQEHILELGCGLGLASLMLHQRGAYVHASDSHPLAHKFLKINQALNGMSDLPYVHAQWGNQPDLALLESLNLTPVQQRYDMIVASDLLYERDTPMQLAELIQRCAKPQAEVWVVDPDRGHHNAFTREMASHKFELSSQICLRDNPILAPNGTLLPYSGRCLQYHRA